MEPHWYKCIICQQGTVEPLICPMQHPGTSEHKTEAYRSFLANVDSFMSLEHFQLTSILKMKALPVLQHTVHFGIKVATGSTTTLSLRKQWKKFSSLKEE